MTTRSRCAVPLLCCTMSEPRAGSRIAQSTAWRGAILASILIGQGIMRGRLLSQNHGAMIVSACMFNRGLVGPLPLLVGIGRASDSSVIHMMLFFPWETEECKGIERHEVRNDRDTPLVEAIPPSGHA